jgi:hypothetical protein
MAAKDFELSSRRLRIVDEDILGVEEDEDEWLRWRSFFRTR